jgi:ribosomal protein S18 acetylase RimI-like enzyme
MWIRDYQAADAAGLRRCLIVLQDFERDLDNRLRVGEAVADAYIADMLADCKVHSGKVLVAEVDGDGVIAGFVAVQAKVLQDEIDEETYEVAYISDVVVLPEYRGRGIGRALLQQAEAFARAQGARWLRIGVLSKNHAAVRLYRHAGFGDRLLILEKTLIQPEV